MRVMGIDPGAVPTVASVSSDNANPGLLFWEAEELAGVPHKSGKRSYRTFDPAKFARVLHEDRPAAVFIEHVNLWPGYNLIALDLFISAARLVQGVCVGAGVDVHLVRPQEWQRRMGVDSALLGKTGSRLVAQHLFPKYAGYFDLAKHHDRADASLIALFGLQRIRQLMVNDAIS